MTDAQKRFCDEYLIDLNATRAYKAVYKNCKSDLTARTNGSKLLTNTNVKDYISKKQKEIEKRTEITQDMIIKELSYIAFSKATDYAKLMNKKIQRPVRDDEGNIAGYREEVYLDIEFTPTDNLTEEQQRALSGIKEGKFGIQVDSCDKVKALELLGKHLGMFKDTNININTNYEEYLKRVDGDEY